MRWSIFNRGFWQTFFLCNANLRWWTRDSTYWFWQINISSWTKKFLESTLMRMRQGVAIFYLRVLVFTSLVLDIEYFWKFCCSFSGGRFLLILDLECFWIYLISLISCHSKVPVFWKAFFKKAWPIDVTLKLLNMVRPIFNTNWT